MFIFQFFIKDFQNIVAIFLIGLLNIKFILEIILFLRENYNIILTLKEKRNGNIVGDIIRPYIKHIYIFFLIEEYFFFSISKLEGLNICYTIKQ